MGITSRDRACEMVETYKEGKKKNIYVQTEFIEIYICYCMWQKFKTERADMTIRTTLYPSEG